MKARWIMAGILLFVWIAWALQSQVFRSNPGAAPTSDPATGAHAEAGPQRVEGNAPALGAVPSAVQEPPVRSPLEVGPVSGAKEVIDRDRVRPVRELPEWLCDETCNRVVHNINNALRAEGLQELDASRLEISVNRAEEALRRYREIWSSGSVYDTMMEERIEALLAAGGPGTGVIDVSEWPGVTEARVHEELARRLGKSFEDSRRNDRTLIRWRKEGPKHVRYGVFAPGADATLDSLRDAYDKHLRSTIRFSLIDLARAFRRE